MSNEDVLEALATVDEVWADQIGTHYEGCWVRHAQCLALHVRSLIEDEAGQYYELDTFPDETLIRDSRGWLFVADTWRKKKYWDRPGYSWSRTSKQLVDEVRKETGAPFSFEVLYHGNPSHIPHPTSHIPHPTMRTPLAPHLHP